MIRFTVLTPDAVLLEAEAAKIGYPEDLANLNRWYGEVSARPSAAFD